MRRDVRTSPLVLAGPARDPNALVFEVANADAAARGWKSFAAGAPSSALARVLKYSEENGAAATLTPLFPSPRARWWGVESLRLAAADPAVPETAGAGVFHLRLARTRDAAELWDDLYNDPGVVGAPNHPAVHYPLTVGPPRPSRVKEQWALDKCGFPGVWPELDGEEPPLSVAVIDQGDYGSHPELEGRITNEEIPERDGPGSTSTHATAVAAVIAARRMPEDGISGCCSARVKLYNVWTSESKFDSLAYYTALKTIAESKDVRVVNLSMGSSVDDPVVRQHIQACLDAGKVVVAAAGNDGKTGRETFPAEYEGVIAVGATTPGDRRVTWSAADQHVFICAPGKDILTTNGDEGFALWSGTSFSAPMVSAAIWLALRKNSGLDREQIMRLLEQSATGGGKRKPGKGFGRLDMPALARALTPKG